jgi:hypothetical protein
MRSCAEVYKLCCHTCNRTLELSASPTDQPVGANVQTKGACKRVHRSRSRKIPPYREKRMAPMGGVFLVKWRLLTQSANGLTSAMSSKTVQYAVFSSFGTRS